MKKLFPLPVHKIYDEEIVFKWYTIFEVIGSFLLTAFGSVFFGVVMGVLGAIITKYWRFISHSPVIETALVFNFGFVAYLIAELLEISGVISILVAGICMSHYLYYNLSQVGRITSGVTLNFIAVFAESFLYVYLGIVVWEAKADGDNPRVYWSWTFFIMQIAIIFFSRFVCVFGVAFLFKFCKKNWRVNNWELSILWYAGTIRGAIAYALIQSLPNKKDDFPSIEDY